MSFKKVAIPLVVGAITAIIALELKREISGFDEVSPQDEQSAEVQAETSQSITTPNNKKVTKPDSLTSTPTAKEITECKIVDNASSEEYQSRFNRESARLNTNIAQLDTLESNLYKLLTDSSTPHIALEKALSLSEKYPNSDLTNYHALTVCSDYANLCSETLVSDTIDKLSDNSAAWLLKAIYHAGKDDTTAVETAIIEASKAAAFNGHWHDYVGAISNVYQHAGDTGTQLQDEIKMGYISAVALPSYGSLHKVCKQASMEKLTLIEACLTAGQLLERDSKTFLAKFIGFSMQEIALEKLDRPEELSRLATVRQAHKALVTQQAKATTLLWRNTPLRHQMLRQIMEHGEIAHAEFAIEEAIKLSNAPNVDDCQTVN